MHTVPQCSALRRQPSSHCQRSQHQGSAASHPACSSCQMAHAKHGECCPRPPSAPCSPFLDSCGAGGLPLGSYQLVTRFPKRVFDRDFSGTVAEAGVQPGQEMFMVQAKP